MYINFIIRYKNGNLVESTENISIECKNKAVHILVFKSINITDCGEYTIKAINDTGEALCTFTLCTDGMFKFY